jgi:hypothetical protein
MAFEAQVAELMPLGDGDVLWLGPEHAQTLVDGLETLNAPPRTGAR